MAKTKTKEDNYSVEAINAKLDSLHALQNIDSEIDRIKILRGELPLEVEDLETDIEKLNDRLLKQENADEELNTSISEQRQKIEDAHALMEKYNAQQMKVRNNREFDAINKEVEFQGLEIELANKKITSFELELEGNGDKTKLLKAKIRDRKKHLKIKKSELSDIVKSTEKEEASLISKRNKCIKSIEKRLVDAYNELRAMSKNGLAVVKVDRSACGGCFSSVTPQHHLNIKLRKDILFCEGCGRILAPDDIDD